MPWEARTTGTTTLAVPFAQQEKFRKPRGHLHAVIALLASPQKLEHLYASTVLAPQWQPKDQYAQTALQESTSTSSPTNVTIVTQVDIRQ